MMALQLVLVLRFMPETRGVRLEDMQQALSSSGGSDKPVS